VRVEGAAPGSRGARRPRRPRLHAWVCAWVCGGRMRAWARAGGRSSAWISRCTPPASSSPACMGVCMGLRGGHVHGRVRECAGRGRWYVRIVPIYVPIYRPDTPNSNFRHFEPTIFDHIRISYFERDLGELGDFFAQDSNGRAVQTHLWDGLQQGAAALLCGSGIALF
jgi:hypothetical protein